LIRVNEPEALFLNDGSLTQGIFEGAMGEQLHELTRDAGVMP
jgi:hypothetical protein